MYKQVYFLGHIIVVPLSIVWKPMIEKAVMIIWPLDDKPATDSIDEKTALKDTKENQHEKSN